MLLLFFFSWCTCDSTAQRGLHQQSSNKNNKIDSLGPVNALRRKLAVSKCPRRHGPRIVSLVSYNNPFGVKRSNELFTFSSFAISLERIYHASYGVSHISYELMS